MKNKHIQYGALAVIVLIAMAYFYQKQSEVPPPRQYTTLERVGDECDLIAAKAAMRLPDTLPFQRMEKEARQARVLETCMNDRGYIQNPDWKKFAEPIAKRNAESKQISVNEAYEALRREKLKTFNVIKGEPPYWISAQSEANAAH